MKTTEGAITVTRAFVDSVGEETAVVIFGEREVRVPVALLPDGVGEGRWIELRVKGIPEPESAATARGRRKTLSRDDGGGPLKL
jgi:hypothetical protein